MSLLLAPEGCYFRSCMSGDCQFLQQRAILAQIAIDINLFGGAMEVGNGRFVLLNWYKPGVWQLCSCDFQPRATLIGTC